MKFPGESPALRHQAEGYPAQWAGRVPLRVRMVKTATACYPFGILDRAEALKGKEYDVYVNSYGAASAIVGPDSLLGIKPDEFEIVAWHEHIPDDDHGMTAEEFNARYPVGTPVRYFPVFGEPFNEMTRTRTPAWVLGNGSPVVSLCGRAGGVALRNLDVIQGEEPALAVMSKDDQIANLVDVLFETISQACEIENGGLFDSMALSAYASAMRLLADYGKMEIVEEAGRRVVARRTK
jgi:hypothetical protein